MAQVTQNSAEAILEGLYSQNPAAVETVRHHVKHLSAEELLHLLSLRHSEEVRTQMGKRTRTFGVAFFLCISGLTGSLIRADQSFLALALLATPLWMVLAVVFFFWRSRYTKEDSERVGYSIRWVLRDTHSSALAQVAALQRNERQQYELVNRASYGAIGFLHEAPQILLRILPTLETANGWNAKSRHALFELILDYYEEPKLVFCILDAAARWRDVDALPQLSELTRRENCPQPLRRHANEVMTLLIAERQKRQLGEGLLRASQRPQGQSRQELLRPATRHAETPPEQLLRPQT